MTAYRASLIERIATSAGLVMSPPLPGYWSGATEGWLGAQDMVVLTKPG